MFDNIWHEEENAVYEIDYDCMKKSGKIPNYKKSHIEENLVQNYFELLLCIFFS